MKVERERARAKERHRDLSLRELLRMPIGQSIIQSKDPSGNLENSPASSLFAAFSAIQTFSISSFNIIFQDPLKG